MLLCLALSMMVIALVNVSFLYSPIHKIDGFHVELAVGKMSTHNVHVTSFVNDIK